MSSMTLLSFLEKSKDMEIQQARVTGELLLQYNSAVRAWLSNNVGSTNVDVEGSAWLKHTSCTDGLSNIEYLPCSFPAANSATPIKFGNIALRSKISTTGAAPNQVTKITTTTTPFIIPPGLLRSDLAGVATIVAAAGGIKSNSPVVMATDGSYGSDPETAIITMIASNNASNDAWLRTDGSNMMHSNITFDDAKAPNLREIKNLSRIQAIISNVLYIGSPGGALTSEQIVVDADARILGNLRVSNMLAGTNALTIDKGDLTALDGGISASKSVDAGGNLTAGVDVIAKRNITAQIFYDANDAAYYVDPDQESKLNALSAKGRIKAGEFVELSGIAVKDSVCSPNGLLGRDSVGAILSCQSGLWASQKGGNYGGTYQIGTFTGGCWAGNPLTGTCSCPSGYTARLSGQAFQWSQWDTTIYSCVSSG